MEVIKTGFEGLVEFRPKVFGDERGFFVETFNAERYQLPELCPFPFVQDNLSKSSPGILRGLHFQAPPYAQGKLVMVAQGRALDVVVDIRKSSPTFGQHYSVVLDGQLKNQMYVPRGFAHGFLALEENTLFMYKCDNVYSQEHEMSLHWNDTKLGIDWGIDSPKVSEKDKEAPLFQDFNTPFD